MKIDLLLFATLKEKVGKATVTIELHEPYTVANLLDCLIDQVPVLNQKVNGILIAVNQEFADPCMVIHAEDEIALFPPVSGG